MKELCVVHLVRAKNGIEPFKRFLESYQAAPGGIGHDLLILFKGFGRSQDTSEYRELLSSFKYETFEVPDQGFDITAYFAAANRFSEQYRYFCFLNSYSVILDYDWLRKLHENICKPGVGLAGATGSWESRGSQSVWEVIDVAQLHYRKYMDKPFLKRAILAGTAVWNFRQSINFWNFRFPPVYFDPFPNYHLRTNAFIVSSQTLRGLKCPAMHTKMDAYSFESGKNGLTKQILRKGMKVIVVGKDGVGYEKEIWNTSKTFRQSEQENLLVSDNQSRTYAESDQNLKAYFSYLAWGASGHSIMAANKGSTN